MGEHRMPRPPRRRRIRVDRRPRLEAKSLLTARFTAAALAIVCALSSPIVFVVATYATTGARALMVIGGTLSGAAALFFVLWWLAGGGSDANR